MNIEPSAEALEYGRQALRAIEAAGGDMLLQQAEAEPGKRAGLVEPMLGELGAWELDARGDADDLEAAAALCRSAGHFAVPYPVAERLARPADLDADGLVVVAGSAAAGPVDCLDLRWVAVTPDGRRSALDFIGSWEWTIPGGTSEIQRTVIAERGLGLPREPVASR